MWGLVLTYSCTVHAACKLISRANKLKVILTTSQPLSTSAICCAHKRIKECLPSEKPQSSTYQTTLIIVTRRIRRRKEGSRLLYSSFRSIFSLLPLHDSPGAPSTMVTWSKRQKHMSTSYPFPGL